MDVKEGLSGNDMQNKLPGNQSFSNFRIQNQQKWEDPSIIDYSTRIGTSVQAICHQGSQTGSSLPGHSNDQVEISSQNVLGNAVFQVNKIPEWDPSMMLNNLSFLEEKIHQLQDLVNLIVGRRAQAFGRPDELVAQQQQLITADLTSIIVQLISTAGSLLPSVKHTLSATAPPIGQLGQLGGMLFSSGLGANAGTQQQNAGGNKVPDQSDSINVSSKCGTEQNHDMEDHELKDEEDADEGENLLPGTYEILQPEKEEILAPHTHFCTICGKGFKRDANLRMHMRGHGDEYKTPAALAKPNKESSSEHAIIKRYSCPFAGCKRNKDHKKFQPLKTILCVKNHYKRTHCDKSYTCSRCHTKKFSVIADLKTHEKHCGKDKWLCSCGTTFSRKDKLFGHIALFQGHTPAIPSEEIKGSTGLSEKGEGSQADDKVDSMNLSFPPTNSSENMIQNMMDVKGNMDDSNGFFSTLNFDTCNFGGFHEFPRPPYDDSEGSFSFLLSSACNYSQKSGGNNME